MTTAAEMDKQSFEQLKCLRNTIYVGVKPTGNKLSIVTLNRDFLFDSRTYLLSSDPLVKHAIGIFDDKNQEHILFFENVHGIKDCINFFYSSSHVIHRRWYELLA